MEPTRAGEHRFAHLRTNNRGELASVGCPEARWRSLGGHDPRLSGVLIPPVPTRKPPGASYAPGGFLVGTGGRTRTDMPVKAVDFESTESTISPRRHFQEVIN